MEIIEIICICTFLICLIGLFVCPRNIKEQINQLGERSIIFTAIINIIFWGSFGITIIGSFK